MIINDYQEYYILIVCFTDQNSQQLEIEDRINLTINMAKNFLIVLKTLQQMQ